MKYIFTGGNISQTIDRLILTGISISVSEVIDVLSRIDNLASYHCYFILPTEKYVSPPYSYPPGSLTDSCTGDILFSCIYQINLEVSIRSIDPLLNPPGGISNNKQVLSIVTTYGLFPAEW